MKESEMAVEPRRRTWDDMTDREQIEALRKKANHLEDKIEGRHDQNYCEYCRFLHDHRYRVDEGGE